MRPRVEMDRLKELVRLHRMGVQAREAARLLRMSPNTERAYRKALMAADLWDGAVDALPELEVLKGAVRAQHPEKTPPQQVSSVEEWEQQIAALEAKGVGPRAILDGLQLEDARFREFGGSLSAVKRVCARLKKARGPCAEDVAIPVETRPGEVAQVDFGAIGRRFDPRTRTMRQAFVFVMVLGHSRHMVARIVFDQKASTWVQLHVEAFEELGGVPAVIVPDNLKAAVVRAGFGVGGETALNRSYRELARHYHFKVDPAPPYQPKKKGKVESGAKYVKGNFFRGRDEPDVEVLRPALARWLSEVAGQRIHGTTRRRPLEVFVEEEAPALLPLPVKPYRPVVWKDATVHRDSHVEFDRRLYSVPWTLVGRRVWLQASGDTLIVFADDERVATHSLRGRGLRSTTEAHLPEHRAPLRQRSREWWEEKAARIGPETARYVRDVFDSDDVLSQLRPVQAIVMHLEKFPVERAENASRRARHFGCFDYRGLKSILVQGLDLAPLPAAAETQEGALPERFRFARSAAELLQHWSPKNEPN